MTAQANQPAKFLVPFAQNDSSRVEIPVTTTDATRASQSAGFPPLTMQPPEAGGVPPQGEDFNGAMNQIARVAWWVLLGGRFPFDSAFAAATQIGGYPKGAVLQGADAAGDWISTVDNNTVTPDTSTDPAGGGYVPGYQYGVTALTGLTGGTLTLTNAQAAKDVITLAGTLTSALTLVVPAWLKSWTVTNNTTGAFAVTLKTAAGSGITLPQNGTPTTVQGDGTNIVQSAQNIAPATSAQHAVTLAQATGVVGAVRNLRMNVTSTTTQLATVTADEIVVESALGGSRYCLASFNATINLATTGVGGMDSGAPPAGGSVGIYAIYNPTTRQAALLATNANALVAEVYGGTLPSGYTHSALVSVRVLNASSQFMPGAQFDRRVWFRTLISANVTSQVPSLTALAVSVPYNARQWFGWGAVSTTASVNAQVNVAADANGLANVQAAGGVSTAGSGSTNGSVLGPIPLVTPQTIYWSALVSAGTFNSATLYTSGYDF